MKNKIKRTAGKNKNAANIKEMHEFLNLSREFMKKLDILMAKNIDTQHVIIIRDAAIRGGEKAYLYANRKNNDRLM